MKPTLEQVLRYAETDLEAPTPPNPYEISLALAAGLLAGGRYAENPEAAMGAAWTLVIPYYEGQRAYEQSIAARLQAAEFAKQAQAGGGGMSFVAPAGTAAGPAESWPSSNGPGETGYAGGGSSAVIRTQLELPAVVPALAMKRNQIIADCNARMQEADKKLREAKAIPAKTRGRRKALELAEQEWKDAAQAQSKAHEMPVS